MATVTFVTHHRKMQVTMSPTEAETFAGGLHKINKPGVVLDFAPKGTLVLDEEKDAEKIAFLRNHRWYGTKIQELGAEAGAVSPTFAEVAHDVTVAVAGANADKLDELLTEEFATHKRLDVIDLIENAQSIVTDLLHPAVESPPEGTEQPKVADFEGIV